MPSVYSTPLAEQSCHALLLACISICRNIQHAIYDYVSITEEQQHKDMFVSLLGPAPAIRQSPNSSQAKVVMRLAAVDTTLTLVKSTAAAMKPVILTDVMLIITTVMRSHIGAGQV